MAFIPATSPLHIKVIIVKTSVWRNLVGFTTVTSPLDIEFIMVKPQYDEIWWPLHMSNYLYLLNYVKISVWYYGKI